MRHNPGRGIMDQLVQKYRIPVLLGTGGVGGEEPLAVGHGDRVGGRGVVGAVALNVDGSAGGGDEGLDIRDGIEGLGFRHLGQGVALDLRDVEHMRALRKDPARALARLVFAALGLVQNLVEHDRRGLLAFADLRAERLPLAIGCPETVPEVLRLGAGPEG